MSNFNSSNICKTEYDGDNNFYDDFSSDDTKEVSDEEVPAPSPSPARPRKRIRRATTPPRKRRRLNKQTGPGICDRCMNFLNTCIHYFF